MSDLGSDVLFSFDTTGSMAPAIADVRVNVEKVCGELFRDIPNLRIGIIAHGDYCDGDKMISVLSLTNDQETIREFIRTVPNTSGGDEPECYELALHTARSVGWAAKSRMLVLIGDVYPHEADFPENQGHLEWRKELDALKEMGIRVYPLQCLRVELITRRNVFWEEVARICDTPLLKLENFSVASEIIMGYAYASAGEVVFSEHEGNLSAEQTEILRQEARKFDEGKS